MAYIVIETLDNGETTPYSRIQSYANGTARLYENTELAARSAQDSLHQPNNDVVNVMVSYIPDFMSKRLKQHLEQYHDKKGVKSA